MAHRSTIKKLPDPMLDEVNNLMRDGRFTIDEITEHLKTMGAKVSRSAVGRYHKEFQKLAGDIRLTKEWAKAIGRELADDANTDATQLVIESFQPLLLKIRAQLAEADEVDPALVAAAAKAIKDLQTAMKSNVDMHHKIREAVAKELASKAGPVCERHGVSKEAIEEIKREFLGLGKADGD